MHRTFYSFAFYLNVLLAVLALATALLFSLAGNAIHYLPTYPRWVLSNGIFATIGAVIMLKYLKPKHYTAAFWIGVPCSILLFLCSVLNYTQVTFGFGVQIYLPLYIALLFLQVAYSVSLWVSAPREEIWLKAAGGYSAVLSLVTFVLVCVVMSGKFIEFNSAIEKFGGPILWAAILVPAMFAMNFHRELQAYPAAPGDDKQNQGLLSFATPITVIAALFILVPFVWDTVKMTSWLPGMDAAIRKVAEPFEARTYVNAEGDTLRYRLLKPLNFDPSESYPIVVCLHGSSGTGSDNYSQVAAALMPEFMSTDANREKYRAFLFVPQCPFGTSWGGTHPLPGIDEIVFEGLASLEQEFHIDPNRRYVTGGSLGGYGTWHFIESHPELFAAAMPICGSGDPTQASKCTNVPVWAFHGENDERVQVSGSRDMINAMKAAGGDPRYTEFPGATHDISRLVVETPGLLDWMFAQRLGGADSISYKVMRMPDGKDWTAENINIDTPGSYCYDNAKTNCDKFGRLYTWEAATTVCARMGERWRLPSEDDWHELAKHYGGAFDDSSDNGKGAFVALTDGGSSQLNILLGGGGSANGDFWRIDAHGFYWTSTEVNDSTAFFANFGKGRPALYIQDNGEKSDGLSVRCVKSN